MRLLTCGSRLEIPSEIMQRFSGVVGGYFWGLWDSPNLQAYAQKYGKEEIWCNFLYGNKHRIPDPSSNTKTIEEWVRKRITGVQYVTHWTLINEFTDDNGSPYLNYDYDNIKKYLIAANQANPRAKLIIADFRPHLIPKWQKIKEICNRLISEDVPLHGVGIQCHFKTRNARSPIPGVSYLLDGLPLVIEMFAGMLPVHLTEVSGWRHYSESPDVLMPLWSEVLAIASQSGVESFCPWWLNSSDEKFPKPMPTFEEFVGAGIYDDKWRQTHLLF